MLRTATVSGWQPQLGLLSRACWATLARVLMTGMLVSAERRGDQRNAVHASEWHFKGVRFHRRQQEKKRREIQAVSDAFLVCKMYSRRENAN